MGRGLGVLAADQSLVIYLCKQLSKQTLSTNCLQNLSISSTSFPTHSCKCDSAHCCNLLIYVSKLCCRQNTCRIELFLCLLACQFYVCIQAHLFVWIPRVDINWKIWTTVLSSQIMLFLSFSLWRQGKSIGSFIALGLNEKTSPTLPSFSFSGLSWLADPHIQVWVF